MIFRPLFMVLMLAFPVTLVTLGVRWLAGPWHASAPPHHLPPGRAPLDILRQRFARGEIDKDGFEERRLVLGE